MSRVMPTLEERLEGLIAFYQRELELPCYMCDGSGKRGGLRDCDCDRGVMRVDRHADIVSAPLLASCIVMMHEARTNEDFATADLVLNWAVNYVLAKAARELESVKDDPEAQERLASMLKKMMDVSPVELGTKLVGGALSQEEIDKLLGEKTEGGVNS